MTRPTSYEHTSTAPTTNQCDAMDGFCRLRLVRRCRHLLSIVARRAWQSVLRGHTFPGSPTRRLTEHAYECTTQ
jgi:hypothetical protein